MCQVLDVFVRILSQLVCIMLHLVPKVLTKQNICNATTICLKLKTPIIGNNNFLFCNCSVYTMSWKTAVIMNTVELCSGEPLIQSESGLL